MGRYRLLWSLEFLLATACGSASTTEPALPLTQSVDESAPVSADAQVESVPPTPETYTEPMISPAPVTPTIEAFPLTLWKTWAPLCQGYPSKQNCDDGDATLFSGLLCLSGESLGCDAVKASQDSAGKFWRSPRRVALDSSNSFSRDMALGVLAYLTSTKDTAAAQSWLQWIDQNSVCQINVGGNCQLRTYRYCRDDSDGRCLITPGQWSLMRRVWDHLGLPPHKEMKLSGESTLILETQQTAIGYQLHLKAVTALLYQRLNNKLAFEAELIRTILQRQGDNLFFRYLQEGRSEGLQEALRGICPDSAPEDMRQWTWERDTNEHAELQSMSWDCIFLGRMLTSR